MCVCTSTEHATVTRDEFVELRRLRNKVIADDIVYSRLRKADSDLVVFDGALVQNDFGLKIFLNGSYDRQTEATIFNFVLEGVGPICRVEANSTIHREVGRTHKHELHEESDPHNNLPDAEPRPDLEKKSPTYIWETLCKQANIEHTGKFDDPSKGAGK